MYKKLPQSFILNIVQFLSHPNAQTVSVYTNMFISLTLFGCGKGFDKLFTHYMATVTAPVQLTHTPLSLSLSLVRNLLAFPLPPYNTPFLKSTFEIASAA